MAAAGLPLLKLSTLLVKTIAKPIASRLKSASVRRPYLRRFYEGIGNGVHNMFARMNVVASGHRFVGVKPLPPDVALSDGISTMSEAFIVSFSAAVIIIDFSRSAASNAVKAEKAASEKRIEKELLEERFRGIEAKLIAMEKAAATAVVVPDPDTTAKSPKGSGTGWFRYLSVIYSYGIWG
jgi:optic atrophy 3 protein